MSDLKVALLWSVRSCLWPIPAWWPRHPVSGLEYRQQAPSQGPRQLVFQKLPGDEGSFPGLCLELCGQANFL